MEAIRRKLFASSGKKKKKKASRWDGRKTKIDSCNPFIVSWLGSSLQLLLPSAKINQYFSCCFSG